MIWNQISYVCTDGNYQYDKILTNNISHVISKLETSFVESINAKIRQFVTYVKIKTKAESIDAIIRVMNMFLFIDIIIDN